MTYIFGNALFPDGSETSNSIASSYTSSEGFIMYNMDLLFKSFWVNCSLIILPINTNVKKRERNKNKEMGLHKWCTTEFLGGPILWFQDRSDRGCDIYSAQTQWGYWFSWCMLSTVDLSPPLGGSILRHLATISTLPWPVSTLICCSPDIGDNAHHQNHKAVFFRAEIFFTCFVYFTS